MDTVQAAVYLYKQGNQDLPRRSLQNQNVGGGAGVTCVPYSYTEPYPVPNIEDDHSEYDLKFQENKDNHGDQVTKMTKTLTLPEKTTTRNMKTTTVRLKTT